MKDEEETREHARLLRTAMVNADGMKAQTLADMIGVSKRTVGNWISRSSPSMPSGADRARLKKVFGDYMLGAGDPVEAALSRSPLDQWRRTDVLTLYQRHLHEQQRDVG